MHNMNDNNAQQQQRNNNNASETPKAYKREREPLGMRNFVLLPEQRISLEEPLGMGNFVLLPEHRISLDEREREPLGMGQTRWGISFCFRSRISLEEERAPPLWGISFCFWSKISLEERERTSGEFRFAYGTGSA